MSAVSETFWRPVRVAGPRVPPEPKSDDPRDHLRHLALARTVELWRHPAPDTLWAIAASPRMWERRAGDDDFAEVRVGVGAAGDDTLLAIARAQLPVTVRLSTIGLLALGGEREPVTALVRAMLAQLAVLHSPDDVRITVLAAPERRSAWDWASQLPHTGGPRPAQHQVIVVDGVPAPHPAPQTTVFDLDGEAPGDAGPELLRLTVSATGDTGLLPDAIDSGHAAALAGWLAGFRTPSQVSPGVDLTDLLDLDARPRRPHEHLRFPIGLTPDGSVVELDLKQTPHGMLIGATGSGKSELLRTVIAALALTHAPDEVNIVTVDYRGSATFAGLEPLPHLAGVMANVEWDERFSPYRMRDALMGELNRRRELRDTDGSARLPSLLVVVDEFNEILADRPDHLDLFLAIVKLGGPVGMHLLLSSQRLEVDRLRGLDEHLSYRIGLRTFSSMESRAVLGVPDAYELPRAPGHGFVKTGDGPMPRFRAAYVSGPHRDRRSVLDAVVASLADEQPRARPLWLPPLDESPALTDLLAGAPTETDHRLRVPAGIVDVPYQHRHDPLLLMVSDNVGIAGGPQSGKSNFLRTVMTALALTHRPRDVQFFTLHQDTATLPHHSAAVRPHDRSGAHRVLAELLRLLAGREAGGAPDDPYGRVFLIIDDWGVLHREHPELEADLTELARRGRHQRINVLLAANRWSDVPGDLRRSLGVRIELRLSEPAGSATSRRAAAEVPVNIPGRGLTPGGLHFLAAAPWPDAEQAVRAAWPGETAPPLQMLPLMVPAADLPDEPGRAFPIGLHESTLAPVHLDPDTDPHLIVVGDPGSGKTSLLRLIARSIVARQSPAQARLMLVDYRRDLLGAIDPGHMLIYATSDKELTEATGLIRQALTERLPGPDVTTAQLRDRGWWRGPDLFVLVDDHDLVGGDPLAGLLGLLPHARDIGLHLIVARRTEGAARAMYQPLLRTLTQLDTPALLLSGSPDEGRIVRDVSPRKQPPGRGTLVTRTGAEVIQTAYQPGPSRSGLSKPGSSRPGSS